MMPTTEELLYQLAVYIDLYPEKTASELARDLGVSPLFAINAMRDGVKRQILTWDKDKDELKRPGTFRKGDWDELQFGEEQTRLQDEITKLVSGLNGEEQDIELEQLRFWCVGVRPSAVELAIYVLKQQGVITSYTLTDPADDKSTYEFLTLVVNAHNQWGKKQFSKKEQTDDK